VRVEERQEHCRHGTEDIHGRHKRLEALVQCAYHETARGGHQWSMAIPSSTQDEHAIFVFPSQPCLAMLPTSSSLIIAQYSELDVLVDPGFALPDGADAELRRRLNGRR
jgi:hypothetical protein